jgi:putative oxidoreductase
MKKNIFYPGNYNHKVDLMILILRVIGGSFMITHGWGKVVDVFSGPPFDFSNPIGLGETASLFLTALAEFLCAVFVILGFATRLSAIPVIITMLVAAFVVHADDAFFAKELPLVYATIFFVIAVVGGGRYSIDKAMS